MAATFSYGKALYYPHTEFRDLNWLKSAALYYNKIMKINPSFYLDDEISSRFNENEEFIVNIRPRQFTERIGNDFISFMDEFLSSEESRNYYLEIMGPLIQPDNPAVIFREKISSGLEDYFIYNKLAGVISAREFELEPVTAAIYLTFLANRIAKVYGLTVITDNPVFQQLINLQSLKENAGAADIGFQLASMVINTVVPDNLDNIPVKKILEFREKYKDERHLFYNEINRLVKDLDGLDNQEVLTECLNFRKRDIEIAVENLEKAFIGMGISTATVMLGLSIPSFLQNQDIRIITAGVVVLATGKLLTQGIEYYRTKNASPYSYVLSLQKNLTAETFAEQLLRGKLLI